MLGVATGGEHGVGRGGEEEVPEFYIGSDTLVDPPNKEEVSPRNRLRLVFVLVICRILGDLMARVGGVGEPQTGRLSSGRILSNIPPCQPLLPCPLITFHVLTAFGPQGAKVGGTGCWSADAPNKRYDGKVTASARQELRIKLVKTNWLGSTERDQLAHRR